MMFFEQPALRRAGEAGQGRGYLFVNSFQDLQPSSLLFCKNDVFIILNIFRVVFFVRILYFLMMIKSIQIDYLGCLFHSLIELKLVLLIEDHCSFLREPIAIYYNKQTLQPTTYISLQSSKYTPDFLVRKWNDNSAFLIEIKPRKEEHTPELVKRSEIVGNYLTTRNLDWKFKVVFDDEIILSGSKLVKYNHLKVRAGQLKAKMGFFQRDKKYNSSSDLHFLSTPIVGGMEVSKDEYARYVKYGSTEKRV